MYSTSLLWFEGFLVLAASGLFVIFIRARLISNHLDNVRGPPPTSYEQGGLEHFLFLFLSFPGLIHIAR